MKETPGTILQTCTVRCFFIAWLSCIARRGEKEEWFYFYYFNLVGFLGGLVALIAVFFLLFVLLARMRIACSLSLFSPFLFKRITGEGWRAEIASKTGAYLTYLIWLLLVGANRLEAGSRQLNRKWGRREGSSSSRPSDRTVRRGLEVFFLHVKINVYDRAAGLGEEVDGW